ncbi:amidase [Vibrio astriarenae]|uniref:Amidase n=1 Tax=Vibrio astriarenae TaxID=1481923 RepID=A0A7Z2T2U7_9VIBR|nr:amidase [Vibrio astriarenae]QIA63266.1 amidase [Vibrio astriarenae]
MTVKYSDQSVYCAQGPKLLPALEHGVLDGLSFVFKDLFDIEGYVTGAGNPAWLNTHEPASKTSQLVLKLLSQGAKCLGRVQTDELAYSLNGVNIHYGTPLNPIAQDCLPGGSSSGSAVAVARGDVSFSLGTDTGGSVRVPASYCGLFGLRPTWGKLSLEHCFSLAKSFDTAGIFSQDLSIIERVYQALCGVEQNGNPSKTLLLDNTLSALMGDERLATIMRLIERSGISLIKSDLLGKGRYSLEELSLLFRQIQGYEIIDEHNDWLEQWQHTLDTPIQKRVEWSRTLSSHDYLQAKQRQNVFADWLEEELMKADAMLLLPTTPGAPLKLNMPDEELDRYRSDLMGLTSIAGLSGTPQLHIPLSGLKIGPCGVSLLGVKDSEMSVIQTAKMLTKGERE